MAFQSLLMVTISLGHCWERLCKPAGPWYRLIEFGMASRPTYVGDRWSISRLPIRSACWLWLDCSSISGTRITRGRSDERHSACCRAAPSSRGPSRMRLHARRPTDWLHWPSTTWLRLSTTSKYVSLSRCCARTLVYHIYSLVLLLTCLLVWCRIPTIPSCGPYSRVRTTPTSWAVSNRSKYCWTRWRPISRCSRSARPWMPPRVLRVL